MFTKGIISYLDMNNGRMIEGVNFMNLRDTGDPVEIAAAHDRAGADELVFPDITASLDDHHAVIDMVRKVAETVFIPFTAGGDIRVVGDSRIFLREGANKISISFSATDNPRFISDATDKFGCRCMVAAIDARHRTDEKGWNTHRYGGRVDVGADTLEWAMETDRLGAEEILLTSIDCGETKNGYDNELTSLIASHVSVPIIAPGGTGNKEHFYDALTKGGADATLTAFLFHYREPEIWGLKEHLWERGVAVRM